MKKRNYKQRERAPRKSLNGKRPIKQKMWDYMRRNKRFRPRDMMVLLSVNEWTVRSFLYPLERAGMIRKAEESLSRSTVMDSTYVFVAKENITQSPYVSSKEVFCYQTGRKIDVGARGLIRKALKQMGQNALARKIGVEPPTLSRVLKNTYPNPEHVYARARKILEKEMECLD